MKGKGHGHMIKLLWGDLLLETSWSSWFTIENKSPLSTFTKHLHFQHFTKKSNSKSPST